MTATREWIIQAAAELGRDHDRNTDNGIEKLVVFLGANNALQSVTSLEVRWSGRGHDSLKGKRGYTVWRPEHFRAELARVVEAVRAIVARHVIWCTVPHVTIAPISRGIGDKLRPGSRYYPYYTRPWIPGKDFSARQDKHITGPEARAVDYAIDIYNADIEEAVAAERRGDTPDKSKRDWYLLDIAGLLDRLAARRYMEDPNARPGWWTPYPLPPDPQGPETRAGLPLPHQRRARRPCHRRVVLHRRCPPHDHRLRADRPGDDQHHGAGRGDLLPPERQRAAGPDPRGLRPAGPARHPRASPTAEPAPGSRDARLGR